jgi:adenylate cyclase
VTESPVGIEIERKFLVGAPPDGLDRHPAERVDQGYLAIAPDGVEARVRRRGERTTLTVKSGPAHVRVEEEIPIDADRFERLWALTDGRRISKTRHLVPLGDGLEAEVDIYAGALEGLVTAGLRPARLAGRGGHGRRALRQPGARAARAAVRGGAGAQRTAISAPSAKGGTSSMRSPLQNLPRSYQLAGRLLGRRPMCWYVVATSSAQ